ncbi:uncharacterized protein LOC131300477 [Rhododendron vialii]|uniref:uncharacterized protein LOC131300477 n=1 Tax=Rhododendron vialii TaxID=182163 RepID=UPI00265EF69D|nr:uncharacterized protein LOC131300477 [Rhododendron vialii]
MPLQPTFSIIVADPTTIISVFWQGLRLGFPRWEESACLGIRKIKTLQTEEVDRCVVYLPNTCTSKFIVSAHLNLKIHILCSCLVFDVSQSTGSLGKDQPKE